MVQHFAKECLVPSNSSLPLLPWLTHFNFRLCGVGIGPGGRRFVEEHSHRMIGLYLALLLGKVNPQACKAAAHGWP